MVHPILKEQNSQRDQGWPIGKRISYLQQRKDSASKMRSHMSLLDVMMHSAPDGASNTSMPLVMAFSAYVTCVLRSAATSVSDCQAGAGLACAPTTTPGHGRAECYCTPERQASACLHVGDGQLSFKPPGRYQVATHAAGADLNTAQDLFELFPCAGAREVHHLPHTPCHQPRSLHMTRTADQQSATNTQTEAAPCCCGAPCRPSA